MKQNIIKDIYGDESSNYWTQVLAYGKRKHQHYNPIKQNETHIYALKKYLNYHIPFHSIIVMVGKDFKHIHTKTPVIPPYQIFHVINTTTVDTLLTPEEMIDIYQKLIDLKDKNTITLNQHISNIHKKLDNINHNLCPYCGVNLVLKKGKYGSFYGCPNFPSCKFTKKK